MTNDTRAATNGRIRILYLALLIFGVVFAGRLFYLQVVRGEEYFAQALAEQQKKYEIPAERGRIYAREGDQRVPLVLNQTLKTVYADPRYVEDIDTTAERIASALGGNVNEYKELLADKERYYVVLGHEATERQVEEIEKHQLPGIGFQDRSYRAYPEDSLAAQVLGFVNDNGEGQYGIEQAMNEELTGTPGQLRAVTDVRGIPLTTSDDSVIREPENGDDFVLTIDRAVQRHVEQTLAKGVKAAKGKSGSAIVMDPHSGAILAMANYPGYTPAEYEEVEDQSRFINGVVSSPYEVGSVIKPFTMSTALNEGAIEVNDTYYDTGSIQVDDRRIDNAGVPGGTERTMTEVIQKSVNTGVVYALQQLSGGDDVDGEGRDTLYDYFHSRFGFGQLTGVEQPAEAAGTIFNPESVQGNNVRYANMTFGQGMTLTMLQVVSAYSSLVNGGTYYKPHVIHASIDSQTGEQAVYAPQVMRDDIISDETSREIRSMMEKVIEAGGGYAAKAPGYIIGGKTGTSQKLEAAGTYSDTLEIGTFLGFGASEQSEYVVMTKVDEPGIPGYAGTVAAAPIFADISEWLIDYYRVVPPR